MRRARVRCLDQHADDEVAQRRLLVDLAVAAPGAVSAAERADAAVSEFEAPPLQSPYRNARDILFDPHRHRDLALVVSIGKPPLGDVQRKVIRLLKLFPLKQDMQLRVDAKLRAIGERGARLERFDARRFRGARFERGAQIELRACVRAG